MKEYIVDYEIWDKTEVRGWGNRSVSISGPDNAAMFLEEVQQAAKAMLEDKTLEIRIVGVFKL